MRPKFDVHTLTVTPLDAGRPHTVCLERVRDQLRGRAQVKAGEAGIEVTIHGNPTLGYARVRAALSCAVGADWADHFEITHTSDPG